MHPFVTRLLLDCTGKLLFCTMVSNVNSTAVLVFVLESHLSDIQSVSAGVVSGGNTGSQGSENQQLQYILEERPGILCYFTPLPPEENVKNKRFMYNMFIYLCTIM